MSLPTPSSTQPTFTRKKSALDGFRRFFMSGLAALLPTLITLWLLIKVWTFLWEYVGQPIIWVIMRVWLTLDDQTSAGYIRHYFDSMGDFKLQLLGVGLAFLLVYSVGLFVGNIIGRSSWRLLEKAIMSIPLVRAIFPAVKQLTDFILAERSHQFQGSRVVAVQPHANGTWSIALITGGGVRQLSDTVQREMVTVFVPSSPTAFAGYVMVVPRDEVIELPLSVEEAMTLLMTGGVAGGMHIAPLGEPPKRPERRLEEVVAR